MTENFRFRLLTYW